MEEYYEAEWYVCKKIYIHKSIDRDFLESKKIYKEIRLEGDANTLEDDYESFTLSSIGIIENMNLMDALEYALEDDYESFTLSSIGIIENMNLMDALEYAYDYAEYSIYQ